MSYLYFSFHSGIENHRYSRGKNAIWMRHPWVSERHPEEDYRRVFDKLRKNGISDAYFHVGPWLDADGGIPKAKYRFAGHLISAAKQFYPELRLHAWIGQMEKKGGGPLDLSNSRTRANIVNKSTELLDLGFHGIHYDIEPVRDGDKDFVDLLRKTKNITSSRKKLLSVASGQLEVFTGENRIVPALARNTSIWTESYFVEIAVYADQIAVMMYDTALPADWLYGNYVEFQTKRLAPLLNGKTTLLIGVPTYEDNRLGHRPWAENIQTAIRGIQKGLGALDKKDIGDFGTAIFAEWTTDENEWNIFRKAWLGRP